MRSPRAHRDRGSPMVKKIEKLILKARQWCEMPDAEGRPMHMERAKHIVQVKRKGFGYSVAACDACAAYLSKEKQQQTKE